jgi:glycosyltransferase involved in cell wall biosynthesis
MGQMYFGCIAAALYRFIFARRTPLNWVIHHSLGDWKGEKFSTRSSILTCKYLSRAPRHIVFVSAKSAEDHRRIGFRPEGFMLIPNACDTRKFHYDAVAGHRLRANLKIEDGEFVFGHVARVHPLKDHPTMLKALELAVKKRPEIVVLFCGAGTAGLAIPAGLHRHVRLLGERTDIPQVMSACDAGVLSSTSEGGPNVIAEFLACERVCVSTAVGAAADMIADAGIIVPISNPIAMANALVAVAALPLPELRAKGLAAKAAVERRFSLEKTMPEFHSLWTDVNDIAGLS